MIDLATLMSSGIKHWALRDQLSIREIARRTGLELGQTSVKFNKDSEMTKWAENDRQIMQEGISEFLYINENGRLDLDDFCCTLSSCFDFDGVLSLSPRPREMFDLLVQIIVQEESEEQAKRWIQTQNLVDWTPAVARVYPDKFRTCIHAAALLKHGHTWIYNIGALLMDLPDDENDHKYYAWVKGEWFFTHMFIEGYHNSLFEFVQNFDAKTVLNGGTSAFETLHLAKKNGIAYEEAGRLLASRDEARTHALARIDTAIRSGFYLEAITLEECFISNSMYNFLIAKDQLSKEVSFHELLKRMVKANVNATAEVKAMFLEVDHWRGRRNNSIHGFISSLSSEMVASTEEFFTLSENTAQTGKDLCEQINEWYAHQAARFLPTRFPSKNSGKQLH